MSYDQPPPSPQPPPPPPAAQAPWQPGGLPPEAPVLMPPPRPSKLSAVAFGLSMGSVLLLIVGYGIVFAVGAGRFDEIGRDAASGGAPTSAMLTMVGGSCLACIGFPLALAGLIVGLVALFRHAPRRGLAIAAVATGALPLLLVALGMIMSLLRAVMQ